MTQRLLARSVVRQIGAVLLEDGAIDFSEAPASVGHVGWDIHRERRDGRGRASAQQEHAGHSCPAGGHVADMGYAWSAINHRADTVLARGIDTRAWYSTGVTTGTVHPRA